MIDDLSMLEEDFEPTAVADPSAKPGKKEKVKKALTFRREVDELRFVLSDPRGRRFLHRLMEECKIDEMTFNGEPMGTAYNEGIRSVGRELREAIKDADFDTFILMQVEANKEENNNG